MFPLEKQDAFRRRHRFASKLVPQKWIASIITTVSAEQGLHIPNPEEAARLRDENRRLRQENGKLRGLMGSTHDDDESLVRPLILTARLEILPKRKSSCG